MFNQAQSKNSGNGKGNGKAVSESTIHIHPTGPLVALVGNPNCGKTALFNLLTGSRQKVANYAGVTVERKEGRLLLPSGKHLRILDLPGAYSLYPRSMDERVTCNVLLGRAVGEKRPDLVVCVVDATNLRRNLRLVLAVKRMGLPCMVALNMVDMAKQRGMVVDANALSAELGLPVVSTVAVRAQGDAALRDYLAKWSDDRASSQNASQTAHSGAMQSRADDPKLTEPTPEALHQEQVADHEAVHHLLVRLGLDKVMPDVLSDKIDRVVLHPFAGPIILAVLLFLIFQAMFGLATIPMEAIKSGAEWLGQGVSTVLPDNWLRSLLVNGVIAGAGGVLVFLPQILILFFFILILEESGYLPRAAFLLDRIMGSVGLSGRSFIPLLSSFACAIPGIMATRTIANQRDRMVTILIAPLMTCSARLPVYALLIGAFIPAKRVWMGLQLQGVVLFVLYVLGIAGAMAVAWLLKRFASDKKQFHPLMMELPSYHWPTVRNVVMGLWQRVKIFLRRVGGLLMVLTIGLWFLSSYPAAPVGATGLPIEYSFAGMIGKALAVVFAPIGFNWQISVALIPGLAAREVLISSLGTVYALSASTAASAGGDGISQALGTLIAQSWSLATALSLLAWFVFAPQCLSTLAAVKRETGNWKMPLIIASYLFALAYLASFITYRVALGFGLG